MGDLDDLAQSVVDWSNERPLWERSALAMLARGEAIADDDVERFADIAEQQARGIGSSVETLTTSDFAQDGSPTDQVRLSGIYEPQFVNALRCESGLTFAELGITLVYGENGSGKSGFARILKKITRSRHSAEVLTDVFASPGDQSATVRVKVGSDDHEVSWPTDNPAFLRRMSFYDSACADRYISAETEVAYRPWAISALDELVSTSARVRGVLERRQMERSRQSVALPILPSGTRAAEFIQGLSASTRPLEVDMACELPDDVDDRLASLGGRIQSLEAGDAGARRNQLQQLVTDIGYLRSHIAALHDGLDDAVVAELRRAAAGADVARQAAQLASAQQFASEPVSGVGSEAWRRMWESARRFSELEAYPDHSFPVVEEAGEPAHCVLCHQSLVGQASARLQSFDAFITADTEKDALEKEQRLAQLLAGIDTLEIEGTSVALALQRVGAEDVDARDELHAELEALSRRKTEILKSAPSFESEIVEPERSDTLNATATLEDAIHRQLDDLSREDHEDQLARLKDEKDEILGRQLLRASRKAVDIRISQMQESAVIDEAIRLTDTRGITRRAADFTRTHVSEVMKHQFSQETLLLGLRRVRLADAGGGQGNLRHRAQFVGAVQRATLESVLSEGEQTALGLAGFLTEVESDTSRSTVVLDDPVTSLDHVRRERVARRLVDLATTRQVVIFTHDVAFMVDLKRAAEAASVAVAERWISRHQQMPGRVADGGPWDARTVRQRIGELEARLAEVRRVFEAGDPVAQQESARSWYQDLRLVWERALEEVVLGPVLVRGRLELRPTNLKVFAKFTDSDNQEFQSAFTRCGDRGSHDRSSELNRPLPSIAELEQDLESIRTWHTRVRGYAND